MLSQAITALTLLSCVGAAVASDERSYYRRAVHHHVFGYTSGIGSCNVRGSGHDSVTMLCRGDDSFRRGVADAVMDLGPKIALALNETFSSPGFNPLSSRQALPVTVIPMKVSEGAVSLADHFEVKAERDRLQAILASLPPSVLPGGVDYSVEPPSTVDLISAKGVPEPAPQAKLHRAVYRPSTAASSPTVVTQAPRKAFLALAERVRESAVAGVRRTRENLEARADEHTEIKVVISRPVPVPPRPADPGIYVVTGDRDIAGIKKRARFAPMAAELADGSAALALGPFPSDEMAERVAQRLGEARTVPHAQITWVN